MNLRTGAITTYYMRGGLGPSCGGLSWSPDGRYLVFTCFDHAGEPTRGTGFQILVQWLDTRTGTRHSQSVIGNGGLVAVNNAGTIAIPDAGSVTLWSPSASTWSLVVIRSSGRSTASPSPRDGSAGRKRWW